MRLASVRIVVLLIGIQGGGQPPPESTDSIEDRLLAVSYDNKLRSHTEREHLPPVHVVPDELQNPDREQIVVKSDESGLAKSLDRKAA